MLNKFKAFLTQPGSGCVITAEDEKSLVFSVIGNSGQVVTFSNNNQIICDGWYASDYINLWMRWEKDNSSLPFIVINEDVENDGQRTIITIYPKDKVEKINTLDDLDKFQSWCVRNNLRIEIVTEPDKEYLLISESLRDTKVRIFIEGDKCIFEHVTREPSEQAKKSLESKAAELSQTLDISLESATKAIEVIRPPMGKKAGSFLRNLIKEALSKLGIGYLITDQQIVKTID